MQSAGACPVMSLHALYDYLEKYYVFTGILLIIGGFWMLIYGGQKHHIFMFLIAQLSVTIFTICFFYSAVYPPSYSEEYIFWLTLIGCLILGSLFGYLA
mmetsp:Transcript_2865/g.1953  ORF Transcript_2865/g.1953 Transcript_2865/m.1953 type:complete len:99 (+) Transcript_2865:119-415(+)